MCTSKGLETEDLMNFRLGQNIDGWLARQVSTGKEKPTSARVN